MAKFRYSHLFTTKTGNEALIAAATALNAAEIGLIVADGQEKILFKNASGDVISVATEEQINELLANKTDYEVNGANGRGLIFNETTGGGAKFEHKDGTWSFVGVNDGGANGIAGQIYAVDSQNGYTGAKIDIKKDGMYYTVGNASSSERDVPANEIAVKGDITAEETRALSAETELSDRISSIESGSTEGLDREIARAEAAESALSESIDDEIANRKAEAVSSADYDSSAKTINFLNGNGDVIDTLDATPFIKDGMIDEVYVDKETNELVIVWNTESGKEETRIPLSDIFDPDNYYTKDEVDAAISAETSARIIAENQLLGEINAEEARATSAETALQTAIGNEATARTAADEALQSNIDNETSARTAADEVLEDAIQDEEARATSAETALQDAIDAINDGKQDKLETGLCISISEDTNTIYFDANKASESGETIVLDAGEF